MNELSLFTGAGGGVLGTMLCGHIPIGYVEWNPYCQRVIAQRIKDGILPVAPIFTDVREFVKSGAARQYRGFADLVTAGFPCQPFSVAGKQLAGDDERDMWPATVGVIRAVRPKHLLLENVPGLVSCGYIGLVFRDLAEMGYVFKWGVLGASDVGAPHVRKRLWVVAHTEDNRCQPGSESNRLHGKAIPMRASKVIRMHGGSHAENVAGTDSERGCRREAWQQNAEDARESSGCEGGLHWWQSERGLDRVAHGIPNRANRLRAIGNGQVPLVAATAWSLLQ